MPSEDAVSPHHHPPPLSLTCRNVLGMRAPELKAPVRTLPGMLCPFLVFFFLLSSVSPATPFPPFRFLSPLSRLPLLAVIGSTQKQYSMADEQMRGNLGSKVRQMGVLAENKEAFPCALQEKRLRCCVPLCYLHTGQEGAGFEVLKGSWSCKSKWGYVKCH